MPTSNLTYASTVSDNWDGAISRVAADDSALAQASAVGRQGIITLTDAPAAAVTINSVQVVLKDAYIELRGASAVITVIIEDSSSQYYTEAANINDSNQTITLTERTTSNDSDAWTLSTINDLRLKITATSATPNIGAGIWIDYVYVILDYSLSSPYDNTLNNITMNLGTTTISGGTIVLD